MKEIIVEAFNSLDEDEKFKAIENLNYLLVADEEDFVNHYQKKKLDVLEVNSIAEQLGALNNYYMIMEFIERYKLIFLGKSEMRLRKLGLSDEYKKKLKDRIDRANRLDPKIAEFLMLYCE